MLPRCAARRIVAARACRNRCSGCCLLCPQTSPRSFFDASPDLFLSKCEIRGPFVLCAAEISEFKNQLAIVRATTEMKLPIVLAGACAERQREYLERCIAEGDGRVHFLGLLDHDDPLLASTFAAASAFVLPSSLEVMPLSVLEALAAGTPVVLTRNNSVDIEPCPPAYGEVDHTDIRALARCIDDILRSPIDRAGCKALVDGYRWEKIVEPIIGIYKKYVQ